MIQLDPRIIELVNKHFHELLATGSTEFKSPGYDEAYTRHLEKELKYHTKMMWIAWVGWAVTGVMFLTFNW